MPPFYNLLPLSLLLKTLGTILTPLHWESLSRILRDVLKLYACKHSYRLVQNILLHKLYINNITKSFAGFLKVKIPSIQYTTYSFTVFISRNVKERCQSVPTYKLVAFCNVTNNNCTCAVYYTKRYERNST